MWFVKSKRAQSDTDYETWIAGGVATTLNVMDNTGDSRATVLIIYKDPIGTLQARDFKGVNHEGARDGKLVIMKEPIVFYGNRVDDIRIQGDVINTLQARMGTGGGNMPLMNESQTVRRLTPVECERLQGFPDNWTEGQADTNRYKQMGNAVAVPVVSWLVNRLMEVANDLD